MAERALATAFVNIVPGTQMFEKNLKSELGGVAGTTTGIGTKAGKGFRGGMLGSIKNMVGPMLAVAGIGAVVSGVKKSFESLNRIEVINTQTEAVIKSTGSAAGITAKQIEDLAGSLERKTATEAESIQSGANLLLTFTNLKNGVGEGNDIFNQTTGIMVDMSRALGQDTSASAMQLGKALNDPIQGVGALRRVGVSFTEDQENMIKSLQESGDLMGAQKIILGELTKEFGGSAEAYAGTFSGILDGIKNEWGTIGETLLSTSMPGLKKVAEGVLGGLRGIVDNLPSILENIGNFMGPIFDSLGTTWKPILDELMAVAGPFFQSIMDAVGPLLPQLFELFGAISPLHTVFTALLPALQPLIEMLGPVLQSVMNALIPIIMTISQLFSDALMSVIENLLPIVMQFVSNLADFLVPILNQLAPFITMISALLMQLIETLMPLIETVMELVMSLASALMPIMQIIIQVFMALLPPILAIINVLVAVLVPVIQFVVEIFKAWIDIVGAVYKAIANAFSNLPEFFKSIFNPILGFVEGFMNFFIDGINTIVKAINTIKFDVPDWVPVIGGQQWGFNLPMMGRASLPRLAAGGLVMPKPGGTIANIAEAGKPEVVYPLDRFEKLIGIGADGTKQAPVINYNNYSPLGMSGQQQATDAIRRATLQVGW